MALQFSTSRRILPFPVILFNFILVVISLVNLSKGFPVGSYLGASYFICIISMLTTLSLSLISLTNISQPGWISYELAFEFTWVTVFFLLQFIAATVISTDPTSRLCQSGEYSQVSTHNICPSHRATLAFAWMAFLILFAHLSLLVVSLISTCRTCGMRPFTVLMTPAPELPLCPSKQHARDTEKGSPASSFTTLPTAHGHNGGARPKHRPAPLNLSGISVTSLPIYHSYAQAEKKKRTEETQQQQERQRTQSEKRPNRHELMAAISKDMLEGRTSSTPSSPEPWKKGHNASTSSLSSWAAPTDWQVAAPHQAMTFTSQRNGNIVDRPDPRDRRPVEAGELIAEGGFWVNAPHRV